ncbi:MAG: hypothetical protein ACPGTU_14630 [Myxococcota bacterium]
MNFALLALLACGGGPSDNTHENPTFIEVSGTLVDAGDGTETIAYSNESRQIQVTGSTLDHHADPYPYNGWLEVSARPGRITNVIGGTSVTDKHGRERWYIQANDGLVDLEAEFTSSFGNTHVWLTSVGSPENPGEGGTYATGVTDTIAIERPTITQLQDVSNLDVDDPFTTSPLFGEFVTVRTEDREVVVSAVTTKGFWASDLADAPGGYSGLFVYTFNKPEGVRVGDRLDLLAGGIQEYVGTTQLSFPLYEAAEGETLTPPPAAALDAETLCTGSNTNNEGLEPFESSLVTIDSATIPANFQEPEPGYDADPDYNQFVEYGQWPVETAGGCRVYVVSNTTVPSFNPISHAGEDIGQVTGMLSYVRAGGHKWMLLVRDADDLAIHTESTETDEEGSQGPPWPPRDRSDPHPFDCKHEHAGAPRSNLQE